MRFLLIVVAPLAIGLLVGARLPPPWRGLVAYVAAAEVVAAVALALVLALLSPWFALGELAFVLGLAGLGALVGKVVRHHGATRAALR